MRKLGLPDTRIRANRKKREKAMGRKALLKLKGKLRIEYKILERVDNDLDRRIENFAEGLGFRWWASGFDFETGYRDICFEKKQE